MAMNEMEYESMQEDAKMGKALVALLADKYGCEPEAKRIDRCVYKNTDCGAWIIFTETGVRLGSIVEGSDAEVPPIDVPYTGNDEIFLAAFDAAIATIEETASEMWDEANAEDGEDEA